MYVHIFSSCTTHMQISIYVCAMYVYADVHIYKCTFFCILASTKVKTTCYNIYTPHFHLNVIFNITFPCGGKDGRAKAWAKYSFLQCFAP